MEASILGARAIRLRPRPGLLPLRPPTHAVPTGRHKRSVRIILGAPTLGARAIIPRRYARHPRKTLPPCPPTAAAIALGDMAMAMRREPRPRCGVHRGFFFWDAL